MIKVNSSKLLTLFSLFVVFYSGCVPMVTCDVKARNEVFRKATFNKEIIENLKEYEKLEKFLTTNANMISSYNINIRKKRTGKDSTQLYTDCTIFFINEFGELKNSEIPPNINEEFTSIYKEVDLKHLMRFKICRDHKVEMVFTYEEDSPEIGVFHTLRWNDAYNVRYPKNFSDADVDLFKDTILNKIIKYEIFVGCNR